MKNIHKNNFEMFWKGDFFMVFQCGVLFAALLFGGFTITSCSVEAMVPTSFSQPKRESKEHLESYVLCKSKKEIRGLRVYGVDGKGYTAVYTREGSDKIIGSGKLKSACEGYVDVIKKKLVSSNWSCRQVKESHMSDLGEGKN